MESNGITSQLTKLLNFVFESSNDICAIVNSKLIIEWINEPAYENIFGYENLIGTRIIDKVHPDDIQYLANELRNINRKKKGRIALRIKTKNEEYIWIELGIHIFESISGDVKFFLIGRDISENKNLERKLKESEEIYRIFIEKSHDFILIIGNQGLIEQVNQSSFQEILGFSNDDLISKDIFNIIHPNFHKTIRNLLKEESEYPNKEIILLDKKGHNVHVEIKGTTYNNSIGEKKVLIAARNISMRKETEKKLLSSEKKISEALDRSEFYKDLFSHDINNILQTILTTTEISLLKIKNGSKNDEIIGLLEDIINQVQRGSNLIDNVRMLSKIESNAPLLKKMDIVQILKDAIKFIKTSYSQDIDIQLELQESLFFSYANELLLEAFENLLINSIKHNDNSKIKILIRISSEKQNNKLYIRIEFHDNGKGIEDNRKSKIFSRIISKEKSLERIGLGLSLVKKIIDTYNGKIWVENKVRDDYSKGSKFIILLPEI